MTSFRPYEPDQLDVGEIIDGYREGGQGNLPYHPAMMLKILICAIQAAKAHRRATLRMGEARAGLPAVQSSRTPECRR